jgi:serine/threonine protein kinase
VSEKNKSASTTTTTTRTATTYALKVISKYDLIVSDEIDMIVREKNIMYQLTKEQPHPFIVKLHATFQNDNFLFLLQECCPGGELLNVMHSSHANINPHGTGLPLEHVAFYTLCIADALEYMHTQHSIVYRDLKPENIMLDSYGYPKLIDMGYAKVLTMEDDYMTYTFCGTPNYIAPEMIQLSSTQGASFQVDHWALGILVHEMIYGSHPFNTHNTDMEQMELFHCICYDEYTAIIPPETDSTDRHDDVRAMDAFHLISQLLIKDPTHRFGRSILGGESIGNHPLLKNAYNIEELRKQTIVAPWIPRLDTTASSEVADPNCTSTPSTDWFQQQYPKLSKREKSLFDAF